MDMLEKQKKLMEIAKGDSAYNVWRRSHEDAAAQFEAFANEQPEAVRDILWAYAAGGWLMNQRLVNLACQYMDFMDEKA